MKVVHHNFYDVPSPYDPNYFTPNTIDYILTWGNSIKY